jgi:hypothetical protein
MHSNLPYLSFDDAKDTYDTFHLFTQIVGKIKLATLPWTNHSWHVTLFVTPTGLTSGPIPFENQYVEIEFDLLAHILKLSSHSGHVRQFALHGISVAEFYEKIFAALNGLDIALSINPRPSEIEHPILFHEDTLHNTYNEKHISALHSVLLFAQNVLMQFRSEFNRQIQPRTFLLGKF